VRLLRRMVIAICLATGATFVFWSVPMPAFPSHALELAILLNRSTPPPQTDEPFLALPPTPAPTPRPTPTPPVPLSASTTVLAYPPPPIQAKAAFLVDMGTGAVLYAKNPDERLPMASTTKITTAIVALQHARLSDLVTTSEKAATIGESTMVLQKGERLTVRDLLYGLLLNSANDAAIALAEHVGGTEVGFVRMMNALASRLHMRNTHYMTAHGLDAPGHYSSARDLSIVARYAMRNATFRRIVSTTGYHIPATRHNHEHWLASVNRVIYWYPGVDGVKPGDTDLAGLCQVVSVRRDGRHLLAVLLNTPTLVYDIRNLLNFGLRDFRWVQAPAWWDAPANSLSGGSGSNRWVYYYGAGHYIRGLFLAYFETHGGLQTLGYPRTDEIEDGGQLVQYFQGAELVYDPAHRSVYPADLGVAQAHLFARRSPAARESVATAVRRLRHVFGGSGVFGSPVTGMVRAYGYPVQFFQYGALALVGGAPALVPLGDVALRLRGWLPAAGASDSYPASMTPAWMLSLPVSHARARPPVARHRIVSRPVNAVGKRHVRQQSRFLASGLPSAKSFRSGARLQE